MIAPKGARVRVSGVNECAQRIPVFEGVVLGVEFRTDPPIVSVKDDSGHRYDVTNLGHGAKVEVIDDA
jgi:hypothetical protein